MTSSVDTKGRWTPRILPEHRAISWYWYHWDSRQMTPINTARAQRTISLTSSGQQWLFHMFTACQECQFILAHWHLWSRMAISHWYWHLVVNNGRFHIFTDRGPEGAFSHFYWHLVVNNGNFILLLTQSGPAWHFLISIDILWSTVNCLHLVN